MLIPRMLCRNNNYNCHQYGVLCYYICFLMIVAHLQQYSVHAAADNGGTEGAEAGNDVNELECSLYLAPSTIPGSGMGMFAGKQFDTDEVLQATGDLVVPFIDLDFYHPMPTRRSNLYTGNSGNETRYENLWDEYTWNGGALAIRHEGFIQVNVGSPGFGSAANSVLDIFNVDEMIPDSDLPPNGMHRSKDPGIGAFSTYRNRQSIARAPIRQGQELFVSYGDEWFEGRSDLGPIPKTGDMGKASKLFQKFYNIKTKSLIELDMATKAAISQDLWNRFILSSSWNDTSRVLGSFRSWNETIRNNAEELLLPELELLLKERTLKARKAQNAEALKNNLLAEDTGLLQAFKKKESSRNIRYLQEHGTCADNINEGVSTLPQAGYGGFASRNISAGKVVAHVPLIHLPDKQILNMYQLDGESKRVLPENIIIGKQLALNYCMGHSNSTLLLCNYGPMVNLINHNKTLANVKLRWSTQTPENEEYFNRTVDSFIGLKRSVLAMELVAIRDIQQKEEFFLDYGNEWEAAWSEHIANWNPYQLPLPIQLEDVDVNRVNGKYFQRQQLKQTRFVTNYEAAEYHNHLIYRKGDTLRTEFEQLTIPYPGNIQLMCDLHFTRDKEAMKRKEKKLSPGDWTHCEVLSSKVVSIETAHDKTIETRYDAYAYIPEDTPYFDHAHLNIYNATKSAKSQIKKLKNMPIEAFRFFDRPYSSDMFLLNAFRHEIRIPDDLFPEKWMNM